MITDKEKLEYIWRIVNEKKLWDKHQLVQIKDILEKRSLTDDQGIHEALELDEEHRLVLLKKEKKLEWIKKMIDGLDGKRSIVPMADMIDKIEVMFYGHIRRSN